MALSMSTFDSYMPRAPCKADAVSPLCLACDEPHQPNGKDAEAWKDSRC